MEEGSYEIMDMDGTPVTEQNWRTLVSAGSTLRIRLLDTGLGDEKDQQENDLSRAQDQPPQNAEDVSLAESIDVFEADSGPENQDYDESAGNPSRDA
ncbi:hypothetical protein N7481_003770 [Penicillium waksmanii]|uniref:uncharacterized protein n=1 Tax=Penicillium waksmanii TaxID=69791 RepID=UPI002547E21F|nr:uncharacterized protein N7481_003770 [Penicillium waksmanii]KAJ5988560.1 hypothetical protein N7481_003770 [Penicillium waksmanii]